MIVYKVSHSPSPHHQITFKRLGVIQRVLKQVVRVIQTIRGWRLKMSRTRLNVPLSRVRSHY